jgi:hypothetical protein
MAELLSGLVDRPSRVNPVVLAARRSLPAPDERAFSDTVGMFEKCHRRTSLRHIVGASD